jgi:hypothetical protein
MSQDASGFTQTRLSRVLKGAAKAGQPASRVVVHNDGRIELLYDGQPAPAPADEAATGWDSVK